MIYLQLFLSFIKIGLFSFGGGLAMIPLISNEIVKHHWMTDIQFIRIIGIAEMTPGPIAINAATFVGFQSAGFYGAVVATIGVALPPLLLILMISKYIFIYSKSEFMKMIFVCLKPVIVALITSAAIYLLRSTIFTQPFQYETLIIALIIYAVTSKWKLHPIFSIILAAGLGWIWHYLT